MNTMLIVITGLSLGLAGVMSLLVWTMMREERQRSAARVAALKELADADAVPSAPRRPASPPGNAATRRARDFAQALDLPLRPTATAGPDLFLEPAARPSWGPRIALAAGALALTAGVAFTYLPAAEPPAAAAPAAPLELLTLRHATAPGSLTVSGIVRNPAGSAERRRIGVTAYALAADGAIVATALAPLDLVAFGPGEESPFEVDIPVRSPVARYRVGFRDERGLVVAHVDRREGSEAVARK